MQTAELDSAELLQTLGTRAMAQAKEAFEAGEALPDLASFYLYALQVFSERGKKILSGCVSCGTATPRDPADHLTELLGSYAANGLSTEAGFTSADMAEPAHTLIKDYLELATAQGMTKRGAVKLSPPYLSRYKPLERVSAADEKTIREQCEGLPHGKEMAELLVRNSSSGIAGLLNEMLYRYIQEMPGLKETFNALTGPQPIFAKGPAR